jgi:hypothetical protein
MEELAAVLTESKEEQWVIPKIQGSTGRRPVTARADST